MNFLRNLFGKKEKKKVQVNKPKKTTTIKAERIGEIGEYKINIQLDQFPNNNKYLSDIMIPNPKARSGYSQIDHLLLTPYGLFVIETKNYTGEIEGNRTDKQWTVNKRFKMMNPFHQNYGHIEAIKSCLEIKHEESIISMISFNRRAVFRINPELRKIQSFELCVYDTELTEFINRKIQVIKLQTPTPLFTDEQIEAMYSTLIKINVTDHSIREKHKLATKKLVNSPESKCEICGRHISEKVKNYCLTNKKFNGKLYCFEHQKSMN